MRKALARLLSLILILSAIFSNNLMLVRAEETNPYDNFGVVSEGDKIVEVITCGYARGEGAFPLSFGGISSDNMIDGGDRVKVRTQESSLTVSWNQDAEIKPLQICVENGQELEEGGRDWLINDVSGQNSYTIELNIPETSNYHVEVKYQPDQGPSGDRHEINVSITPDLSGMPDSDPSNYNFNVAIYRDNEGQAGEKIDGTESPLSFSKNDSERKNTKIYAPDEGGLLIGFAVQCAGQKIVSGSYDIGAGEVTFTSDELSVLQSENLFTVPTVVDGNWITSVDVKLKIVPNGSSGGPESGGSGNPLALRFEPDLSELPGDNTNNFGFEVTGIRPDNSNLGLSGGNIGFSKSNCEGRDITLSIPNEVTKLGFRVTDAGQKITSASYNIGAGYVELNDTDLEALRSGNYQIDFVSGESRLTSICFKVKIVANTNPGSGGSGTDVTFSENTTLTENTVQNDVRVNNGITLTIDGCKLRIDHRIDLEDGASVVGTDGSSKLEFAGHAFSNGLDLFYTDDSNASSGPSVSFTNGDGVKEFIWNTEKNRWETEKTDQGPDVNWYTVSYGNSANLTTEHGQVYAERVHVGDKIYTSIESEYNASSTDNVYSLEDTIFYRKTQADEENPDFVEPLETYGVSGSDGDIMIRNDVSGVSIDFKFIPDFGYQLSNIYTNEDESESLLNQFVAAEAVSSFKFDVIQGGNVHFEVKFVESSNTITGNAGLSSSASIESANAASSGTLEMQVDNGTKNTSDVPSGSEALAAYDITLKNVVSKGDGRGNWDSALTDLGSNSATLKLPVDDTTNYTYTVIREHAGDSPAILDVAVVDGGISFETNKFSTYTIVRKPVATSIENAEVTLGSSLTYNGSAQTQSVASVKLGETTLNASTDYVVTDATQTDAGTYTLVVTGTGNYTGTVSKSYTITKKTITPSITGTYEKTYDGTKVVSNEGTLSINLGGLVEGDEEVTTTVNKYEFDSANVGENLKITATGIALTGVKAANYTLSATTAEANVGKITKATPTITLGKLNQVSNATSAVTATLSPASSDATVTVVYKVLKTPAKPAVPAKPCKYANGHLSNCAYSVSANDTCDCGYTEGHEHDSSCGYAEAEAAVPADYEWTTTAPTAVGEYDVRAYLKTENAGANLNATGSAEAPAVTGTLKITQYVAPSQPDNSGSDDSNNSTQEETKPAEKPVETPAATPARPAVTPVRPTVTPVEPTKTEEKEEIKAPEKTEETKTEEKPAEKPSEPDVIVETKLEGDSKEAWATLAETILESMVDENGETIKAEVKVEMGETKEVPVELFEEIKGMDVDVVFKMDNGISWIVNGTDIGDVDFTAINLEVKLDNGDIPEQKIEAIAEGKEVVNLSLTHDGEFGFKATLTVDMGTKNAGMYANLYYYNPETAEYEFITAAPIDENGNAALGFEHASDYTIVIDTVAATVTNNAAVNAAAVAVPGGFNWPMLLIGLGVLLLAVIVSVTLKSRRMTEQ